MPPTKKPDKKKKTEPNEEPAGYNINIMSLDQLKQYAKLLQKEIEDMRTHCNFYQKTEDELFELFRITEDDLGQNEDNIVSKDIEQERLKLKFQKNLREKRQCSKYMEHASFTTKEKLKNETDSSLEQEEERHLEETKRLNMILQEKDQQLEALRVKIEMARRETKERNESSLEEMHNHQESLLERAIDRFDNVAKETQHDFEQALEMIKLEAREEKIRSERAFNDACEAYKLKLHDYYKEVTKQDLDAIRKLKQDIKNAKESIASSKLQLKKALEENQKLKEITQPNFAKRINHNIVTKYDASPPKLMKALKVHNKTEKLVLENQNLEEQIKNVTEKTDNLRRQFTSALRKVRETAEMKPAFLERKLIYILDEKKNESEKEGDKETERRSDIKTERGSDKETEKEGGKEKESDTETETESDEETEKENVTERESDEPERESDESERESDESERESDETERESESQGSEVTDASKN